MKKISRPSAPAALALLGGILLSAGFAPLQQAWAAWIGPGLILFSAVGKRGRGAFWLGFLGGLVHFLSSLYWLINMPLTWHGLPLAPTLGWVALSGYCALYPGLWVWLSWKIFPGGAGVEPFLATGTVQRLAWSLVCGAAWTALEFCRGTFLTGFPWNFTGATQYQVIPLIQIASITGVQGVSFLVVWTSVSLCGTALMFARGRKRQTFWAGAGVPVLVVAAVASFGFSQLNSSPKPAGQLKVAMIQPGIPQTEIWDASRDMARFQTVLDLSQKALAAKPQLLLWPESAVPDLTPETQQLIAQLVRERNTWLVFCAGTAEPGPAGETQYFNSALICDPEGALKGIYHKRRLVIFGEYVPLVHWLPFLKFLTDIGLQTAAGQRAVDFDMTNPKVKMSVLICFEDMFPQEAREHVGPDTDFLVNLTNDGWFGHGAEQWQQAAGAIFRAVENGVPLLRCTNDGLTCWADSHGRIHQILGRPGNVYAAGFLISQIPLRGAGSHSQTIYNLYGDWFCWACAGLSMAALAMAIWKRKVSHPKLEDVQKDAKAV